jgi:citrate synthase
MAEKPSRGLTDAVAAATALSDIDGQAGRLSDRGYDTDQLAGSTTFEEIAFLLQRGHRPDQAELDSYRAEMAAGRALGSLLSDCLAQVARRQGPMEALRSLVSLSSADQPVFGMLFDDVSRPARHPADREDWPDSEYIGESGLTWVPLETR